MISEINSVLPGEKRPYRVEDTQKIWSAINAMFSNGNEAIILSGFNFVDSGNYFDSGVIAYQGKIYTYDQTVSNRLVSSGTLYLSVVEDGSDLRTFENGTVQNMYFNYVAKTTSSTGAVALSGLTPSKVNLMKIRSSNAPIVVVIPRLAEAILTYGTNSVSGDYLNAFNLLSGATAAPTYYLGLSTLTGSTTYTPINLSINSVTPTIVRIDCAIPTNQIYVTVELTKTSITVLNRYRAVAGTQDTATYVTVPTYTYNFTLRPQFNTKGFMVHGDGLEGSLLANGSVTNIKLADGAVTNIKLADGAVTNIKLADGAVNNDKLSPNCVTSNKIYPGSVVTAGIADGNVTTAKVADEAITTTKIADDSITNDKLVMYTITNDSFATNSVDSRVIVPGGVATVNLAYESVTAEKLGANSVTTAKLVAGSVAADVLGNNSVTNSKIQDGAIMGSKLASGIIDARVLLNAVKFSIPFALVKIVNGSLQSFSFRDGNNNLSISPQSSNGFMLIDFTLPSHAYIGSIVSGNYQGSGLSKRLFCCNYENVGSGRISVSSWDMTTGSGSATLLTDMSFTLAVYAM